MTSASNEPFVFQPTVATVGPDGGARQRPSTGIVQDTRREISEIVREVAVAARSERSTSAFLGLLADRVLRAMAAEGVVVWQRKPSEPPGPFLSVRGLGKITAETIATESIATHQVMLSEVAREGQPIVVPATPGASDPDVPANPTRVPVAVVPIDNDSGAATEYLLEVFLDPDGGIAAQRGYLRFAAQMADLAGEFLRAEQLRQMRRGRTLSRQVDDAIVRFHSGRDRSKIEAAIVDSAAELFGFQRVGLCLVDGAHTTLAAVSHVNRIDQRSDGATQIRQSAGAKLEDGLAKIEGLVDSRSPSEESVGLVVGPTQNDRDGLRLVALGGDEYADEHQNELVRFINHANVALQTAGRFDAIPGGRWLAALAPSMQASRAKRWMRPFITCMALALILCAALFPIPLYVHSPATIRPTDVQRLTAPRDAIVSAIHVQNGQQVIRGEPILTLTDLDLEQRATQLMGRRAVLLQKQKRWNQMLIDPASHDRKQAAQLEGELSLSQEEMHAIDAELQQLDSVKASLVLRADRTGVVDAWRLRERLEDRPMKRGDHLIRIVATDSPWVADVQVPQNRIDHLHRAASGELLTSTVALESTPNETMDASLLDFGPAVRNANQSNQATVRLELDSNTIRSSDHVMAKHAESPAKATFHCGSQPAAYVLLQDVIRSARSNLSLYFGIGTTSGQE